MKYSDQEEILHSVTMGTIICTFTWNEILKG